MQLFSREKHFCNAILLHTHIPINVCNWHRMTSDWSISSWRTPSHITRGWSGPRRGNWGSILWGHWRWRRHRKEHRRGNFGWGYIVFPVFWRRKGFSRLRIIFVIISLSHLRARGPTRIWNVRKIWAMRWVDKINGISWELKFLFHVCMYVPTYLYYSSIVIRAIEVYCIL